jgi:hypothetical protein
MKTAYEILTEAQDLIRDPAHWTQQVYARNPEGFERNATDSDATCFCSLGALHRVLQPSVFSTTDVLDMFYETRRYLTDATSESSRFNYIHEFNDEHTHEQVMAVWDKARELARANHV